MTPEQHLFILLAALAHQRAGIPADGQPVPISTKISSKDLAYVISNFEFTVGKIEGDLDWTLSLTPLPTAAPLDAWTKAVEEAREANLKASVLDPAVTKVIQ